MTRTENEEKQLTTINTRKTRVGGTRFIIETDPSDQEHFVVLNSSWPVQTIGLRPAAGRELLLRVRVMRLSFPLRKAPGILALILEVSDQLKSPGSTNAREVAVPFSDHDHLI